jgi:hypothetical protein
MNFLLLECFGLKQYLLHAMFRMLYTGDLNLVKYLMNYTLNIGLVCLIFVFLDANVLYQSQETYINLRLDQLMAYFLDILLIHVAIVF